MERDEQSQDEDDEDREAHLSQERSEREDEDREKGWSGFMGSATERSQPLHPPNGASVSGATCGDAGAVTRLESCHGRAGRRPAHEKTRRNCDP